MKIPSLQKIQRQRMIAWLFSRLNVKVKEPCLRCGMPYLVDRPRYDPDRTSLCPQCKPRPDHASNALSLCDCGQPTAVIIYMSIYHPENAQRSLEATALCDTCAIDELLARIKGQV